MSMLKSHSHILSLSYSLTLTLSHSHTHSISHSITLDMLNNFCFHVYAQKSLFIAKIAMLFFWQQGFFLTKLYGQQQHPFLFLSVSRAGSQLKSIAIFGYKQRLMSIDMKTKLAQHVRRDWMRHWKSVKVWECESVRVWECESVRVTFEHSHENKSCSACGEWLNERMRECENVTKHSWFPAFVWHSDIFYLLSKSLWDKVPNRLK